MAIPVDSEAKATPKPAPASRRRSCPLCHKLTRAVHDCSHGFPCGSCLFCSGAREQYGAIVIEHCRVSFPRRPHQTEANHRIETWPGISIPFELPSKVSA